MRKKQTIGSLNMCMYMGKWSSREFFFILLVISPTWRMTMAFVLWFACFFYPHFEGENPMTKNKPICQLTCNKLNPQYFTFSMQLQKINACGMTHFSSLIPLLVANNSDLRKSRISNLTLMHCQANSTLYCALSSSFLCEIKPRCFYRSLSSSLWKWLTSLCS